MKIPGVRLKSWEYHENPRSTMKISKVPKKSWEYDENPRSTKKIQIILGVQNPPFPP